MRFAYDRAQPQRPAAGNLATPGLIPRKRDERSTLGNGREPRDSRHRRGGRRRRPGRMNALRPAISDSAISIHTRVWFFISIALLVQFFLEHP
jgi:hypothetical protein